jgi:hypothetical protein
VPWPDGVGTQRRRLRPVVPSNVDDIAKVDGIMTMLARAAILFYPVACITVH